MASEGLWRAAHATRASQAGRLAAQHILVVSADDRRLTWPEREFIRHIGEKLYGRKDFQQ